MRTLIDLLTHRSGTPARPSRDRSDSGEKETPVRPGEDRRLARAIARAAELGHDTLADRLSARATQRLHASTCLTEEVARQHLRRGRPHRAINVLDAGPAATDSRRLLRAICLAESGRRDEAALDLCSWSRSGSAPLDALLLLAHAAWDAGELDEAADLLHRCHAISSDPMCTELLLLLAIDRERPLSARRWFEQLRETPDMLFDPAPLRVLGSLLSLSGQDVLPKITSHSVRTLAMELSGSPASLLPLTRAAIAARRQEIIRLIADAVRHGESDLAGDVTGMEALVRCLHALREDREAADMLREGRRRFPLSAALARLEQELDISVSAPASTPRDNRRGLAA
jgi:hypothetical protein